MSFNSVRPRWILGGWVLACLFLLGCRGGDKPAAETLSPTPTLFVATASPAGIAGPPQTAPPSSGDSRRSRAEAFLRRIALTDADLPPHSTVHPPMFRDISEFDPSGGKPVFSYSSAFDWQVGSPLPSVGAVKLVDHTSFAFADSDSARMSFSSLGDRMRQRLLAVPGGASAPRVESVASLGLGDETIAWRATGPGTLEAGMENVRWAIVVRRGAAVFGVIVEGAGGSPDSLAPDLARRLDQRLAAALPSAWP